MFGPVFYKPNSVPGRLASVDSNLSRPSITQGLKRFSPTISRGTILHRGKDLAVSPFDFAQSKP